ncbi:MAG: hypothetical protein ABSA52_18190 [Candidatus Binatia bacterium]
MPASLIALCGGILVASFLKSDWANNDFERFDDLRLLFLFFVLFVGLCWAYVTAYLQRQAVSRRALVATCVASAALLLVSFPVGSKDVFFYAFYGKVWGLYHANPYVATLADFPSDRWQPFVQSQWRDKPAIYGPLFLWQSWLVNAVAHEHLWLAVWLYKVWATLTLFVTLWVADAILHRTTSVTGVSASFGLLLLAWNPLFLFESAGSGHNEIGMLLLLLAALWCWRDGRFNVAFVVLVLSVWYKWYSIIFVPAFLIATLKDSGFRAAVRHGALCGAVTAIFGLVLLWPFPGSLLPAIDTLLHSGALRRIYPAELSPPLAALFWSLRASGLLNTDLGFHLFYAARIVLFGGTMVAIFIRQWRAATSLTALTESCCLVAAAFFLLLVTILPPWHLLLVVALAVISGREFFVLSAVVLTVLGLLSYFLTFAVATLMLGLILGALWLLRHSQTVMARAVNGGG